MGEKEEKSGKEAVKLRKRIKDKKPEFKRQESWRYKRIKESWRRPRGIDSKMRMRVKGWPKIVDIGYRGPKIARNLHPSGYEEVLVWNIDDVYKVDPKTQAIRIAHTVGMRKKVEIFAKAREMGIHVLNPLAEAKEEVEEAEVQEEAEETGGGELQ